MNAVLCEFYNVRLFGYRFIFVARRLSSWHLVVDRIRYQSGELIAYTLWLGPVLFMLQVQSDS